MDGAKVRHTLVTEGKDPVSGLSTGSELQEKKVSAKCINKMAPMI